MPKLTKKQLKERSEDMFSLFGAQLHSWIDCNRCGSPLSCRWGGLVYSQPCRDCQNTDEWQQEQEEKAGRPKERTMDDILGARHATAVYEIKDKKGRPIRNVKINNHGDIIGDDPWKPLKTGK